MDPSEIKLPLHEDLMQLARLGEVGPIQKLLDEGKFTADYKDAENITPLHWAAINNHYALCQFLIEQGADVNAIGGVSEATPAHWAIQRCHYYTVSLLLRHGADPNIGDGLGYKMIHLATFDGNAFMLLIILLHPSVSVDEPDAQGHTALMWAAYNRLPAIVDLLLRFGASVKAMDETGFQPLHWALVRGSPPCILKLLENGSDRFAVTSTDKTPATIAEELKTTSSWHQALKESGYNEDATLKQLPLPHISFVKTRGFLNKFFFMCPFPVLLLVFTILSRMVVFAAVPLAFFCAYCMQWAAQQVLLWAPSDMKHLHRTVNTETFATEKFENIFFGIIAAICCYFYTFALLQDPGFVPKLSSRSQQQAVVDELLTLWKFDNENFCSTCFMTIIVLGSITALQPITIDNFIYTSLPGLLESCYLQILPPPAESQCNLLSEELCSLVLRDPFTVTLGIWCTLQLTWMVMLFIVQSVQIARAMTTYESMHGHAQGSSAASEVLTSALTAGTTSLSGASLTNTGTGPDPAISSDPESHANPHKVGFLAQWKKLLGLDTFVATAMGRSGRRKRGNPFSRGIITNCKDFWFDPAPYFGRRENGLAMLNGDVINYTTMYDTPPRIRTRRARGDQQIGTYQSVDTEDAV
ncbi:MAG: hypothetical protein Q9182_001156 [Xanthomendoza sp. 2 TL-2023]